MDLTPCCPRTRPRPRRTDLSLKAEGPSSPAAQRPRPHCDASTGGADVEGSVARKRSRRAAETSPGQRRRAVGFRRATTRNRWKASPRRGGGWGRWTSPSTTRGQSRGADEELSERDWESVIDVKPQGAVLLARKWARMRGRRWGRLITWVDPPYSLPGRKPTRRPRRGCST